MVRVLELRDTARPGWIKAAPFAVRGQPHFLGQDTSFCFYFGICTGKNLQNIFFNSPKFLASKIKSVNKKQKNYNMKEANCSFISLLNLDSLLNQKKKKICKCNFLSFTATLSALTIALETYQIWEFLAKTRYSRLHWRNKVKIYDWV